MLFQLLVYFIVRLLEELLLGSLYNLYAPTHIYIYFQGNDILDSILEGYPKSKKELYVSGYDCILLFFINLLLRILI